jgi:hypothetical protein
VVKRYGMIRKSGIRFSETIMLKQETDRNFTFLRKMAGIDMPLGLIT